MPPLKGLCTDFLARGHTPWVKAWEVQDSYGEKLHYVVLECRLEELPPLCLSRGSLQGYLQMGASLLVLNPLPAG